MPSPDDSSVAFAKSCSSALSTSAWCVLFICVVVEVSPTCALCAHALQMPACSTGCSRCRAAPIQTAASCACCLQGIKIALTDGAAHAVDSSEMAFKLACQYAFREAFGRAKPVILEPVMDVDVRAPAEFQGTIIGDLNRRKGVILNSEGELDDVVMKAQVTMSALSLLISPPNTAAPMWVTAQW